MFYLYRYLENRVQSNTISFTYANFFKKNLLHFAQTGCNCAKKDQFCVRYQL